MGIYEVAKSTTDLMFGTSRLRRLGSAILLMLIFLLGPYLSDSQAFLFSIIGGVLGSFSSVSSLTYLYDCRSITLYDCISLKNVVVNIMK